MEDRARRELFDRWADTYDQSVSGPDGSFPFTGYEEVHSMIVREATAERGMTVLDVGVGVRHELPGLGLVVEGEVEAMQVRDEPAETLGIIASRIKDEAAVKAAIAALHETMADADFFRQPGDRIAQEQQRLKSLEGELATAYERWETLESLAE